MKSLHINDVPVKSTNFVAILHNCVSQKATNCWQTSRIETWNETWFIIIIEQSLQLMETNAMNLIHAVVLAVHVNGHLMEWINKKSTDYTIERPNDDQSVSHNHKQPATFKQFYLHHKRNICLHRCGKINNYENACSLIRHRWENLVRPWTKMTCKKFEFSTEITKNV